MLTCGTRSAVLPFMRHATDVLGAAYLTRHTSSAHAEPSEHAKPSYSRPSVFVNQLQGTKRQNDVKITFSLPPTHLRQSLGLTSPKKCVPPSQHDERVCRNTVTNSSLQLCTLVNYTSARTYGLISRNKVLWRP